MSNATNPVKHNRIFAGMFPCGISYADRHTIKGSDYKRLAFLPYDTLELQIEKSCPKDLKEWILADAAKYQAMQGSSLSISVSGQTVLLGNKCPAPAFDAAGLFDKKLKEMCLITVEDAGLSPHDVQRYVGGAKNDIDVKNAVREYADDYDLEVVGTNWS
ncbi:MAG: hypothetical protein ACREPQ_13760 [Rhodanobacter sp.]